jgi:hypothetical protein
MSRSVYFAQREHLHNGPKWPPCEQASGNFPIAVTACERQRDDEAVRNGPRRRTGRYTKGGILAGFMICMMICMKMYFLVDAL